MQRIVGIVGLTLLASIASAQGISRAYWLLAGQAHEWCGYTDPSVFQGALIKQKPAESAIVTYTLGRLTEVIHQVQPQGADWSVVDKYTPASGGGLLLQRTSYLMRQNLQVVQSALIRAGRAAPALRVVAVNTLQGQKTATAVPPLPNVPIISDPATTPFMLVVTEMRHESVPTLCRKVR